MGYGGTYRGFKNIFVKKIKYPDKADDGPYRRNDGPIMAHEDRPWPLERPFGGGERGPFIGSFSTVEANRGPGRSATHC